MPASTNQLVDKARKIALPAGIAAATAVLASAFAIRANNVHASAVSAAPLDDQSVSALTAMDNAMENLASRVTPAIVNVAVTSRGGEEQQAQMQGTDPQDLPPGFSQFFGNPFGGGNSRGGHRMSPDQQPLQHGIGSGVIISPDGYIVTNNHVVDGATQIKVTMHDRRVLTAKVIGTDKLTDLAVIKVDSRDLPYMSWGDSEKLHPGQTVLAFGSPFGYFQFSVTRGIVSAVNRQNPYSDDARKLGGYIQTDAAINPGNSGGALVNSHGELIGINTFIISDSGSFAGAGFAIPAQVARATADQIIKTGGVHHGYLGISMNDVTPENAHFFNLSDANGAIVAQVTPNSPASRAGLQNGDVIRELNGKKMTSGSDLQLAIAGTNPGTKVQLGILRNGKTQNIDLTVGEYNAKDKVASNDGDDNNGSPSQQGKLGLAMSDVTPDIRQQLNLPDNIKGAAIASVRPGSPAEDAGLQPGDIIVQVNRKNVESAKQAVDTVHTIPNGQDVLLLVWSRGGESYRVLHQDQG
jgi:serine protease Do